MRIRTDPKSHSRPVWGALKRTQIFRAVTEAAAPPQYVNGIPNPHCWGRNRIRFQVFSLEGWKICGLSAPPLGTFLAFGCFKDYFVRLCSFTRPSFSGGICPSSCASSAPRCSSSASTSASSPWSPSRWTGEARREGASYILTIFVSTTAVYNTL